MSSLRRVLILAYHWPPIGGIGPARVLGVVRTLRENGYEPIVITGTGTSTDRFAPIDATLGQRVPEGIEVIRIGSPEPDSTRPTRVARFDRMLSEDDPFAEWWAAESLRAARSVGPVDIIWAYMRPYVSARVATQLARERGVPWVADLTDPWAFDENTVYPTAVHRAFDLRRMRASLASASAIVTSAPEACRQLNLSFPELSAKLAFNGYGYDQDAFSGTQPSRTNERFRIVHAGTLHTDRGHLHSGFRERLKRHLGGRILDVNLLTRSHVYLLQAVSSLVKSDPPARQSIEIVLAGPTTASDRAVSSQSPLVRMLGPLPYEDSIELMRSANLLFLPMHEISPGKRARIIPGKTYDYLAAQRPILAAVPPGDVRTILTMAGNGSICDPSDASAIEADIKNRLARWRSGLSEAEPDPAVLEMFSYHAIGGRLAAIFDDVLDGRPIAPGPLAETWTRAH